MKYTYIYLYKFSLFNNHIINDYSNFIIKLFHLIDISFHIHVYTLNNSFNKIKSLLIAIENFKDLNLLHIWMYKLINFKNYNSKIINFNKFC